MSGWYELELAEYKYGVQHCLPNSSPVVTTSSEKISHQAQSLEMRELTEMLEISS